MLQSHQRPKNIIIVFRIERWACEMKPNLSPTWKPDTFTMCCLHSSLELVVSDHEKTRSKATFVWMDYSTLTKMWTFCPRHATDLSRKMNSRVVRFLISSWRYIGIPCFMVNSVSYYLQTLLLHLPTDNKWWSRSFAIFFAFQEQPLHMSWKSMLLSKKNRSADSHWVTQAE